MHRDIAKPFCEAIQEAARAANACGLVMDLGSMARATPPAGAYGLQQLRGMVIERIAFVGGNRFMRLFARTVLTLGRFGQFRFFEREVDAVNWAGGHRSPVS